MNLSDKLTHLANAKKLPHAVVIEGQNTADTLELFIKSVLCEGENKPCMVCKHCQKVATSSHPDVLEFFPEGANKGFKIDTIRKIREMAYVSTNEAAKKVIVFHDADYISNVSQNALLKILEEPPEHVVFAITVKQKSHLLDTILSRVTLLLCDEQQQDNEILEDAFSMLENLCLGTHLDLLQLLQTYLSSKDKAIEFVLEFETVLRTLYRVKLGVQKDDEYSDFAERLTLNKIIRALEITQDTRASLVKNKNRKLTLNYFCVKLKSVI